jgi:pimeloyl-ACP methyl ester carboxylesterase
VQPIDLDPGEATLWEGDPERCVVLLPGVRYFSQAPLLWFAREAALAGGWSVLELSERAPGDQDPFAWIVDRAERALAATHAERVVMVGKSLGSAAAPLAGRLGLPAVWLTPLIVRPEVAAALAGAEHPTLIVGSRADQTWSGAELPRAEALEVFELVGLDHSLQVEGDPQASLDVLREVTERISAFLRRVSAQSA